MIPSELRTLEREERLRERAHRRLRWTKRLRRTTWFVAAAGLVAVASFLAIHLH